MRPLATVACLLLCIASGLCLLLRSVFALTLPAFCVLSSKLEWDLSNELHAKGFSKWLEDVAQLAAAIEGLVDKLPQSNPEGDLTASLLWKVELGAGIAVRSAPSLEANKCAPRLPKVTLCLCLLRVLTVLLLTGSSGACHRDQIC